MARRTRSGAGPEHGGPVARFAARWLVRLRWFIVLGWVGLVMASLFVLPPLEGGGGSSSLSGLVPSDTPAVANELRDVEIFGFPLSGRTAVIQRDPDGLSVYAQGRTAVAAAAVTREQYPGLGTIRGALPLSNSLGLFPGSNERDTTAVTYLLFDPSQTFGSQTRAAQRYIQRFFDQRDAVVGVSGSVPARGAQGDLIRDALPKVELYTVLAIMIIVGIALRSVVAPAIALLCAGAAYVLTLRITAAAADLLGVSAPSELEPVVVALLLGVITDYVIFYLTAMRRELAAGKPRLVAAEIATTRFGPIVLVAGLAVAAGTAALLVAQSLFFRALGPALVLTVLVGLVVAVTLAPALMAILGRWCFFPVNPTHRRDRKSDPESTETSETSEDTEDTEATDRTSGNIPARTAEEHDDEEQEHAPRRLALLRAITSSRARAAQVVVACVAVLGLLSLPLLNLQLGLSFVGSLPPDSGVRVAADASRQGLAAGILSPTTVLVEGSDLDEQQQALVNFGRELEAEPGVAGVLGPGDVLPRIQREVLVRPDGSAARYLLVLEDEALGAEAIGTLDQVQARMDTLVADSGLRGVRVGLAGDTATGAFIVDQTNNDLLRIAVAALAANLLMLLIFLRALVAAVYLLVGSMLSLGAALGLTSLLFGEIEPGAGLTFYVPFAAAVLLLAFGSDYNIYAVGSIWEGARRRPLHRAILAVMPSTIAAIVVAGLTLAASFGLLSVVPLSPFRQLAFVMAVGIMLDVLVVRTLLLPAMLTLVGPASAWPSKALREAPVLGPAHPRQRSR